MADLTLHTDYEDINALADGFVDRVEQDTLILYGPDRFETEQRVEFEILLADGGTALAGAGRVRASVDGGDERPEEQRFDVIVDNLNFEGRYGAIHERLLMQKGGASLPPEAEAREATQPRQSVNESGSEEARASDRPSKAPGKKGKGKRNSIPPDEASNGHSSHSMLNGGRKRFSERPPVEAHVVAPDAAAPPADLGEPEPFVLSKPESSLSRPRYPRLERAVDSLIPKAMTADSTNFNYPNGLPPAEKPPLPGLGGQVQGGSNPQARSGDFDDFDSK